MVHKLSIFNGLMGQMSLEFPGGPLQTLKCVKKSQKCLFTEKKNYLIDFDHFWCGGIPYGETWKPKIFLLQDPQGGCYGHFKFCHFLAQKSHFLAKRGPFWVPVTPSTMKFEILTLPYYFHIKFMLESTKKNMLLIIKVAFWPFLPRISFAYCSKNFENQQHLPQEKCYFFLLILT